MNNPLKTSWPWRRTARTVSGHYLAAVRWRLALSYGLIVMLLLLALVTALNLTVRQSQTQLIRSQLVTDARKKAELPDIATVFRQRPVIRDEEESVRLFVVSVDGVMREADAVRKQAPDPRAMQRVLKGRPAEFSFGAGRQSDLAIYTMPVYQGVKLLGGVQAVTPRMPYESLLHDLLTVSLISGAVIPVVAALAALLMAGWALRPIRRSIRNQQVFAQNAAHELRAPLAVLRTAADLALAEDDIAEMREALKIAVRQSEYLDALAGDLRTLVGADTGQLVTKRLPVDLAGLVDDVYHEVRPLTAIRDISIETVVATPVIARGDEQRLRQVLLILLDNALKYTPPGGRITLDLISDRHQAKVRVTDTGRGIPVQHLPHIFERFYRSEEARTPGEGGVGLGLAIAREIVEAHGGRIAVVSVEGKGSTFTVELPID